MNIQALRDQFAQRGIKLQKNAPLTTLLPINKTQIELLYSDWRDAGCSPFIIKEGSKYYVAFADGKIWDSKKKNNSDALREMFLVPLSKAAYELIKTDNN